MLSPARPSSPVVAAAAQVRREIRRAGPRASAWRCPCAPTVRAARLLLRCGQVARAAAHLLSSLFRAGRARAAGARGRADTRGATRG